MRQQWYKRVIAHFFGVEGVLDEQRVAVIGRASINAVVAIFGFELFLAVGGVLLPIHDFEQAYYLLAMIQFLGALWVIILTVNLTVRRAGINHHEVTAGAYPQARRRLRRKWLVMTPILGATYHLLAVLLDHDAGTVFNGRRILMSCFWAITIGTIMYQNDRHRLKIVEDEF